MCVRERERAKSYVYFGSGNISQNVSFVAISTLNDTGDTLWERHSLRVVVFLLLCTLKTHFHGDTYLNFNWILRCCKTIKYPTLFEYIYYFVLYSCSLSHALDLFRSASQRTTLYTLQQRLIWNSMFAISSLWIRDSSEKKKKSIQ